MTTQNEDADQLLYTLRALVHETEGYALDAFEDQVRALVASRDIEFVRENVPRAKRRARALECARLWVLLALSALAHRVRGDVAREREQLQDALRYAPEEKALERRLACLQG